MCPAIVPRWEWRTFGDGFGAAQERLATAASEGVHESDELYLLSPAGEESVKVRDGLLDVKQLVQVREDGLELQRRVARLSRIVASRPLRDWCLVIRASDTRIDDSTAFVDPSGAIERQEEHEVTIDAAAIRALTAAVTIPWPGLPLWEAAPRLGVSIEYARRWMREGALRLMRRWRETSFAEAGRPQRLILRAWARFARRPRAYHAVSRIAAALLGRLGRARGAFTHLPFAASWTRYRDLPAPQGPTFQHLWAERRRRHEP